MDPMSRPESQEAKSTLVNRHKIWNINIQAAILSFSISQDVLGRFTLGNK
jgi:hypothetical protein